MAAVPRSQFVSLYGLESRQVVARSKRAVVRVRGVMDGRYRAPLLGDRNRD
jgi:hypothetical protein